MRINMKGAIWLLKTALAVERTRVKKLQDDLKLSLIEVKKAPNHVPNTDIHIHPVPVEKSPPRTRP
ncbi:hypothetical protein BT96DRAFT_994176 [Gymnopus androsaceus JB14]|uniref:Uncharacterized protein n=1 Tax=Gymnopus androsaceus JB14 TaxID=1447944 RepID=A0A6A4HNK3_9AGAR|nr:hypothetical protein BT96DRAFT_994176 [Gymnopus androsaceus JB14]